MSQPVPPTDGVSDTGADDERGWREAARLRNEHPKWVVIWLAATRQYRAYLRTGQARRDAGLTASTPDDLAALMTRAEQQATRRRTTRPRGPSG
jgi:hypothetical protein